MIISSWKACTHSSPDTSLPTPKSCTAWPPTLWAITIVAFSYSSLNRLRKSQNPLYCYYIKSIFSIFIPTVIVNFICQPQSSDVCLFQAVSVDWCFQKAQGFESVTSQTNCLPSMGVHHPIHWGPELKGGGRENLLALPGSLNCDIQLLPSAI